MTKAERDQRWQEIFDNYDRAIGDARHTTQTLSAQLTPLLTRLIDHLDQVTANTDRIATAVHDANRAALALYRDEHEKTDPRG